MKRAFWLAAALSLTVTLLGASILTAGPGVGEEEEVIKFVPPPKPKVVDGDPDKEPGAEETTGGAEEEPAAVILDPVSVLPEKCPFFATVPRMSQLIDGLKKTAVAKVLAEREVVEFLEKISARETDAAKQEGGRPGLQELVARSGFTIEKIGNIFSKQAVLAVLPGQGSFRTCAVFAVDEDIDRAQEFITRILSELKRAYPATVEDSYWEGDIEVRTLDTEWGILSLTSLDNLLIVGYGGKHVLDSVIEVYLAEGGRSFADNADYKRQSVELGKGAELYFQADLGAVVREVASRAETGVPGLKAALALGGMQNLGLLVGTSKIDRGGFRDTIVLLPAESGPGFLPQMPREKSDFTKIASYIPPNALYFDASQQDFEAESKLAAAYMGILPVLKMMPGMSAVDMKETTTILKFVKKLHPAFGGQVARAVLRTSGQLLPDAIAIVGVNDMRAAKELAREVEKTLGWKFHEQEYSDHAIRYVADEKRQGGRLVPGTSYVPAYAFSSGGDLMLVGTSVATLKKAIRQRRFGRLSVMHKDDFKRVTEGFSVEKSAIAYLDLKQTVELAYSNLLPYAGMVAQRGMGVTAGDFPSTESVTKHLLGVAWCLEVDDDGARFQSYGLGGIVTAIGLGVVKGVPLAMDHYARMAQDESKNKLRVMGMGLHLFAADNDRFPMSLSELFPMYVQNLKVFQAPRGAEIESVDDIASKGGYVYVAGRQLNDLSESVLIYEKPEVSVGGRNMLRLDMSVKFVKDRAFDHMFDELIGKKPGGSK